MILSKRSKSSDDLVAIDDYIQDSMCFTNERKFEYKLNEKSLKKKLKDSTKRVPMEIEENSTSSNLVFSLGAWYSTVLPSINYWNEIRGDKVCRIDDYTIKIIGFKGGADKAKSSVDTQIVFHADTDKITCHF